MYKFIKIRHDIIKQYHGNYKMKKFNYKLKIEIFRNSTQKKFGCPEGCFFKGLCVQKGQALLVKTMLTWQVDTKKYACPVTSTDIVESEIRLTIHIYCVVRNVFD